ncbi:MAG: hypothetical protein A2Y51_00555 [Gallionellales bacterium RIFCSPLOWO2_02_60_31]|nr:MAG: hypothetical protein A2Y51_00555 [Gallionellales bacterium RIFCSPLOWO2_02_60_31]
MIVLPRIPALSLPKRSTGRIALAIALSALVHAIALFAPLIKLPPVEVPLPPLTAKLEPLPKIAAKPAPPRKHKPRPVPVEALPADQPAESVSTEEPQIDAGPQPPAVNKAIDKTVEEARPAHPLPKHAQLTFAAYKGKDFKIGEARHRLEIGDDKSYILRVGMNTTGLASIFKTFESDHRSSGTLTAQGLRPNEFSETKNTSKGRESLAAKFSWEEKVLSFSNGNSTPLPEQAQDVASFLYQFPQLALDNGAISMYISNGKKLERYEFTIGEEEMIQTHLGRLRALPLHKVHAQGEEGLDIWLGLEYRLLPVKLRMFDRSGQIAGEMVISEILVADE